MIMHAKKLALLYARLTLGIGFLSGIADRFGLWRGRNVGYGNFDGFISYTAGAEDDGIGSHVVHIIGYVSNEDIAANPNTASATPGSGGGYFIIKNSWGAAYGDAGYSYMPVQYLKEHATEVIVVSSFNQN